MAIKKIKIAMGAEYLSDVKSIATFAFPFFGYIILGLASVLIPIPYFKAAGASRRYLNAAWLISSFVFLDEIDVSHNVIYVDQPDLALPRTMYLDTESYADYIAAYKTFMLETAMVMARYVMKFVF